MAFLGLSWGGFEAPIVLAVEPRFAAGVVFLGGLECYDRPRPEVDQVNYVGRVRLPVLMLGGRCDMVFPLETSARPLYQRLGTPAAHKVLKVYETDHAVPQTEYVRESLAWLDKYLGPVQPAATAARYQTAPAATARNPRAATRSSRPRHSHGSAHPPSRAAAARRSRWR